MSIIKLIPPTNGSTEKSTTYYLYSNTENKYVKKTKKELKEFLSQFDKSSLHLTNWNFTDTRDDWHAMQVKYDLELQ